MKVYQFGSIVLGIASLVSLPITSSASASDTPHAQARPLLTIASTHPIQYTPPPGLGTPKRTQGGGSRGCNQAIPVAFTLLVPAEQIGLTLAAHPTFAWYSSEDSTTPLKFSLVEPGGNRPLWTQEVMAQKTGINTLALSESAPSLAPGRRYRWTLTQLCNQKRSSETLSARGWVQRVELAAQPPASASTTSTIEQAQRLAQAGLWYDAIAVLSQDYRAVPQDKTAARSLLALLEQGGLQQVAEQERKRLKID